MTEAKVWQVIGFSASLLTMFGFIPQLIRVWRTKSAGDISVLSLLQLSLGVSLWALYGWHLGDLPIILANSVTLITLIALLYLRFIF